MVTYNEPTRERERERERESIRTLAENIQFICTSFRYTLIIGPLIKIIELLTLYCYFISIGPCQ